jgi:hypothetical protein
VQLEEDVEGALDDGPFMAAVAIMAGATNAA